MARSAVPANRPWEAVVGYSRAVRVGSLIEVSSTAAWSPPSSGPAGSWIPASWWRSRPRRWWRIR